MSSPVILVDGCTPGRNGSWRHFDNTRNRSAEGAANRAMDESVPERIFVRSGRSKEELRRTIDG